MKTQKLLNHHNIKATIKTIARDITVNIKIEDEKTKAQVAVGIYPHSFKRTAWTLLDLIGNEQSEVSWVVLNGDTLSYRLTPSPKKISQNLRAIETTKAKRSIARKAKEVTAQWVKVAEASRLFGKRPQQINGLAASGKIATKENNAGRRLVNILELKQRWSLI